jgi:RES domain-containing protein
VTEIGLRLLEKLDRYTADPWQGQAYRHLFGEFPPDRPNTRGARWNPPEVPAIYTALSRETLIAEVEYQMGRQPFPPKAKRTIYILEISLQRVISLPRADLPSFEIETELFGTTDYYQTQRIGEAVEWLGHDGLIVPSARAEGDNLVVFPNQRNLEDLFQIIEQEVIQERQF